ncbi:hypothetical protein ACFZAR_39465 [Streptomyces sp. NPDC008222]|uniref:hypothetical protein n=1 Tax=Streptomyces sp. NPDC008222 TaxID=3364820 RepID=UPI0036EBD889
MPKPACDPALHPHGENQRTRTASTITDVLQPRNVLLDGLVGLGFATTRSLSGAAWGLFATLCAGIVPASYIQWVRRRGTWGDRHVVDRRQRPRIFAVILASIGVGSTVMILANAPTGVLTAMIALWLMTVVLLTVNSVWKISVDSAVASAVASMLVVHSPVWLLAFTLVVAVCWSRVALTYHTVAQTVAGASLGVATAGVFALQ